MTAGMFLQLKIRAQFIALWQPIEKLNVLRTLRLLSKRAKHISLEGGLVVVITSFTTVPTHDTLEARTLACALCRLETNISYRSYSYIV